MRRSRLFIAQGVQGKLKLLFDPGAGGGQPQQLDWWLPSPDGGHVAMGLSPGGSENSTLRVLITATGGFLPERIDRTKVAHPSWLPDGSGLFYNRLRPDAATGPDAFKNSACWLHRLGTDPAVDRLILSPASTSGVTMTDAERPTLIATAGSNLVIARVAEGPKREAALYVAPLNDVLEGREHWRPVCKASDGVTGAVVWGHDIYLLSYKGAARFQLLRATGDIATRSTAMTALPEGPSVLQAAVAARDGVYVQDLTVTQSGLRRIDANGAVTAIELPFAGAIDNLTADPLRDGAWFLLQGWVRPTVLCYVGADGVVVQTELAPRPAYDTSSYVSEELFAVAKDGTKVPVSVIYKNGLKRDGSAPLLLDGYGAYGEIEAPNFSAMYLPLLDLGGVFAVAHVRGGGELGETWHLQGQKKSKPNTWRDFIAVAEHLIAHGYTSPSKLGVVGGSAGAITVGRFMTERPELAAVVICGVGVNDMVRMPASPEFGSPDDKDDFDALYDMDAYLHVIDGVRYPAVLLITGMNDSRVPPWQTTKMAARLQSATRSDNPVLLVVEGGSGHVGGSPRNGFADNQAFFLWRTGDPRFQPALGPVG